ncbi:855_t:CDS:2, partial [Ambispora leptoticha]
ASNAKVNKHKSILIPLTENACRIQLKEAELLQVHDADKPLTILRYKADIIGNHLSMRNLSLKGKILQKTTQRNQYNHFKLDQKQIKDASSILNFSTKLRKRRTRSFSFKSYARLNTGIQNKRNISIKAVFIAQNIKLKGWPDRWKPYLKAWIRTKGQVVATNNWLWPLEDLKIEQATADNYSVKIYIEALRKELPSAPTLLLNAETPQ